MKTHDQITIDTHLDLIKDERYTKASRDDALAYIQYLREFGTETQKKYIYEKTEKQELTQTFMESAL